ncbi:uncharacterized protein TRUGW13939_11636 [Talaromyces rugulosus]|uniref:Uncharacterized protein n=1 Tax=Talaromyces rugulosus TaxID=121627 RepID=A0A7H8RD91_TALRU|nr:uncharacterized protein TRUGW13939_11636 [Talaromyces rugulosus]QKX64462.1 hypothetical protein TRUGW13939_11636 [Talaromyces rugulosus]
MACFAHLRDSVPSWISDANQLSVHVYTKRAEFAAETRNKPKTGLRKKPATASLSSCNSQRPLSLRARSTRRGLKRILSRESIREVTKRRRVDAEEEGAEEEEEEEEEEEQEVKPVILYDGHTQKALEQMVRHIWSAKSSIRSSRISTSMQSALRGRMRMRMASTEEKEKEKETPSTDLLSAIEVDDNALAPDDDNAEPEEIPDFRITRRPARQKESPYDFIEAQLDAAQNLCESAAYRFLREGNCLDELEGLVGAYELVLEAATTMAEQEEERLQKEESELATTEKEAEDDKRPGGVLIDGADSPDDLNSAILEVDDRSDTSEVSIDITAFRMTRYGQRTLHPFTLTRAAR